MELSLPIIGAFFFGLFCAYITARAHGDRKQKAAWYLFAQEALITTFVAAICVIPFWVLWAAFSLTH